MGAAALGPLVATYLMKSDLHGQIAMLTGQC